MYAGRAFPKRWGTGGGRLPASVREAEERAGDTAPGMGLGELGADRRVRARPPCLGSRRRRTAGVSPRCPCSCSRRSRAFVVSIDAHARRDRRRRSRWVRRRERARRPVGRALRGTGPVAVGTGRDDDGGDAHVSTIQRGKRAHRPRAFIRALGRPRACAGRLGPAEPSAARGRAATRRSRSASACSDPVGERLRVARLDEDRRVARHLRQRARVRRDDRRPGGHGLEHGQAETLVAGREDEAGGAAVERCELAP